MLVAAGRVPRAARGAHSDPRFPRFDARCPSPELSTAKPARDAAGETTVQTRTGLLFPGQSVTRVVEYLVDERSIPGLHEITISVEGSGGTSSATTVVEVI